MFRVITLQIYHAVTLPPSSPGWQAYFFPLVSGSEAQRSCWAFSGDRQWTERTADRHSAGQLWWRGKAPSSPAARTTDAAPQVRRRH